MKGTLSEDIPFSLLSDTWPLNLYPFLAVIPGSGSILVISGNKLTAYVINETSWYPDLSWGYPVSLPVPVLYPQTAAILLLPLDAAQEWSPQVSCSSKTH